MKKPNSKLPLNIGAFLVGKRGEPQDRAHFAVCFLADQPFVAALGVFIIA